MASAWPGTDTSPGAATISRRSSWSRATTRSAPASSGRWFTATRAPFSLKISTAANPMPEAPPVTSTVLPIKSADINGAPNLSMTGAASGIASFLWRRAKFVRDGIPRMAPSNPAQW